jgi:hypothetical protein
MPYIKQEDREKFVDYRDNGCRVDHLETVSNLCENAGDLNYAITVILQKYMEKKGECYATHNEIIGMLDCCSKEWYRRKVAPYEDLKIEENGDV